MLYHLGNVVFKSNNSNIHFGENWNYILYWIMNFFCVGMLYAFKIILMWWFTKFLFFILKISLLSFLSFLLYDLLLSNMLQRQDRQWTQPWEWAWRLNEEKSTSWGVMRMKHRKKVNHAITNHHPGIVETTKNKLSSVELHRVLSGILGLHKIPQKN